MVGNYRSARRTAFLALALLFIAPLITGQGCPGSGNIRPIVPNITSLFPGAGNVGASGNILPFFAFIEPATDLSREIGDIITISWVADDPDNNAAITIYVDPDGIFGNGNERVIVPLVLEDTGITSFNLNTGAELLTSASYRVIARMSDGVNPELLVVAPGRILLFGAGLLPGNISPAIIVTQPTINIGASQNDVVNIAYCANDPDDGEGGIIPDVILLLDFDDNPDNDLDLSGPNAALTLSQICQGGLPANINGAIIIGCAKDNDCANVATPTQFVLNIDVSLFPPTPSGEPYRIRATMWDRTNRPVHSYAPGRLSITALGSGLVDLGDVGRTISGAKFMGFDAGGRTGSASLDLEDMDLDGIDDFIIVSKFGRPGGGQNAGTAHLVFGQTAKFAGEIPLNSVSTLYRGTLFLMSPGSGTDGIVSVARVEDLTSDGKPEILFGMPEVLGFFDEHDDDPWDCPNPPDAPIACYFNGFTFATFADGFPNPWSETDIFEGCGFGEDCIGSRDHREIGFCSNDFDLLSETRIDGGYAIMVSSINDQNLDGLDLENEVLDISAAGQAPGGGLPNGVRFRGAWYPPDDRDFSQTTSELGLLPFNRFGQTVNTMPPMTAPLFTSPRSGINLLISAPNAADGRGRVFYLPAAVSPTGVPDDLTTSVPGNSQSLPYYDIGGGGCPPDIPIRTRVFPRGWNSIAGAFIGDGLGYGAAAGDYNLDGSQDILCGAPGADRNGIIDGGIVYIIFGRPDFSPPDLQTSNPPRMEIRGTNPGDRLGAMQTIVGDVNHDGLMDIGFASEVADGPGGLDAGFVGIVFGGRRLTGENIFTLNQVATAQLPGTKIYGSQPNGHVGTMISNVGDFNGDGTDDLLICAPNETRTVNSQTRRGVAYLLFGGPHFNNATLNLSQIGTVALPGIVFASPYAVGTADEAPIDGVGAVGDVNDDGFADILVGVSTADYINPLEPGQRRIDAGEAYLIYGSNTGSNNIP